MGIETTKLIQRDNLSGSGMAIRLSQSSVDYFMSKVEPEILGIFNGSTSPSYIDYIKYKNAQKGRLTVATGFDALRKKLHEGKL